MTIRGIPAVLAAAALLTMASAGRAGFITTGWLDYQGEALTDVVRITYAPLGYHNLAVYAGQARLHFAGTDYLGYCVDLAQYSGDAQATAVAPSSVSHGDLAAWLFDTYASTVVTADQAAALQAAIWEVLAEGPSNDHDISTGQFKVGTSGQVRSLAQSMLSGLPGSYTPLPTTWILSSPTVQDMMVASGGGNGGGAGGAAMPATPEPGTIVLLACGAATWAIRRQRRK